METENFDWKDRGNEVVNILKIKLAKAIESIRSDKESLSYICEKVDWNDNVCMDIDEAFQKLGEALASLTLWDNNEE